MLPDSSRKAAAPRIPPAVITERVALVAGGKGGVGTSVMSALLALGCASAGARVLLVDGNEYSGSPLGPQWLSQLFQLRGFYADLRHDTAVADHDVAAIDGAGDAFADGRVKVLNVS